MDQWLAKINKLTNWQAVLIITATGFAVFFTGLSNPFIGDDQGQIVDNLPVHSITNIRLFFEGGTFYNGQGLATLNGVYYRPLMTTVFSLLYTIFGAHSIAFHLFQLLLCIGSAVILYLYLRYSFKPVLALFLALVFLVHPINSQIVFAIPTMQDALFFFFGILALWLLVRLSSIRSLLVVAACLLLSLLSKETGVLFVALAMLYLFWWDRRRLLPYIGIMISPIVLYMVLKVHAVGLNARSTIAPIDQLGIAGRLLTAPSVALFYIVKFVFPLRLASGYYWVNSSFGFQHVLLPLIVDAAVVAFIIYMTYVIRARESKAMFCTYLFFVSWAALGLLVHLQLIPLDFTASEAWFYFPMAGVLGMIGVLLLAVPIRIKPEWLIIIAVAIISVLGVRTAIRATNWRSGYSLAIHDIVASKEDYVAYYVAAGDLIAHGKLNDAKKYTERSISIFPTSVNYTDLCFILTLTKEYPDAMSACDHALEYGDLSTTYIDAVRVSLLYGAQVKAKKLLYASLEKYPKDSTLWQYMALVYERNNDNLDARAAISNAARYGKVNQTLYNDIMKTQ